MEEKRPLLGKRASNKEVMAGRLLQKAKKLGFTKSELENLARLYNDKELANERA